MVTNIYRIAQGLRNKMEREVLADYGLSWTAFSLLYDLLVWNSLETKQLAKSSGVTKATVSNITNTLERKQLCYRSIDKKDKRKTFVTITEKGSQVMRELYPVFHQGEVELASSLTKEEQTRMAGLLRRVIRHSKL
ncbi:DNA-binding transcriptional regulator, MarR family [Evansella caseinilytica]|uniref:DNA-binding transcriptional regulator, MarR family n=1 Tax=Evansella caseinilytica TaxID=1503961 RepID=A0A1H3GJ32_9BACI|nr:DNA-binding transcriptional regulator, MarR family [Evansella caseinilytica]